jgi:hypothetical protein
MCVCVLTVIKTIKMYIALATKSWRDNMVANQQTGSLKGLYNVIFINPANSQVGVQH